MLDKIFKITGIFAFLAVIAAGIGIVSDISSRKHGGFINKTSSAPPPPYREAQKNTIVKVLSSQKSGEKLALLLNVENPTNTLIPIHDMHIEILDKSGHIIDSCTTFSRIAAKPKQNSPLKVVCPDMFFLQKYTGEYDIVVAVPDGNF